MCEDEERDNTTSSHPAIRRALAFLLEEAYRCGDTNAILILSDTMRQFDALENSPGEGIDGICRQDIDRLILFLKKYLSLDRATQEGLINQLIRQH